jgi:hypothetical protein
MSPVGAALALIAGGIAAKTGVLNCEAWRATASSALGHGRRQEPRRPVRRRRNRALYRAKHDGRNRVDGAEIRRQPAPLSAS